MSDTDRVYALFVQVNPVPEPDLLPQSWDEAELPTYEGSTVMKTIERTEVRPPERVRRWKPAAVFASAFVIILAIAGGIFLLSGGEDSGPVAAADARPVITCDGASCTYDGPTRINPGIVEFTIVNTGSREISFGVWHMAGAALAAELERTPVGTDMALTPDDPVPDGELVIVREVPAGRTATQGVLLTESTHLIDMVTASEESNDHVWRVAAIEVIPTP